MNRKGKKLEPKLYLDMDFAEAIERFAQTDPNEVAESIERSKKRKPLGRDVPGGLESKPKGEPPKHRRRKRSGGASAD